MRHSLPSDRPPLLKSAPLRHFAVALLVAFVASATGFAADAINPPPPFTENFGKLVAGKPVPDLTLQGPGGSTVYLSSLIKGKTAVLSVWRVGLPEFASLVDVQERLARRYAAQGVQFIAIIAYTSRRQYDWFVTNFRGRYSFPVLFDPAGSGPEPGNNYDTMSPQAKEAYIAARRQYLKQVAPVLFAGEGAPMPNTVVIDAQGGMLGFYQGSGRPAGEALANLLLRAGVELTPGDMPRKVYTADETKPPPPPEPETEVPMLRIGQAAPDFAATDANGNAVKISDFRGKIVILDFWATWCGPCQNSMPHTQEVAVRYRDQGVVVLACCTEDTRAKFDEWVPKNQPKYPDMIFFHDPQGKGPARASHQLYGVDGIPQQFIIGRNGKVASRCTGYLKGEVLLEAALAQAGVEVDPAIIAKSQLDLEHRRTLR